MQLSFLGKSYSASTQTIEGIPTGETGTFMGKPYARKQFNVSGRRQHSGLLTYRGVNYIG